MIRKVLFILLFIHLSLGSSFADAERDAKKALQRGADLYDKASYEEALTAFEEAADFAEKTTINHAPAMLNQANTLVQLGRHGEASELYLQALRCTDLDVQHKAYYNRGNVLIHQAQEEAEAGELERSMERIHEAFMMYENAITLQPKDLDSKINYELAQALKNNMYEAIARLLAFKEELTKRIKTKQFKPLIPYIQQELPNHEWALKLKPKLKEDFMRIWQSTTQVVGIQDLEPVSKPRATEQ